MKKLLSFLIAMVICVGAFAENDWHVNFESRQNNNLVLNFNVENYSLNDALLDGENFTRLNFNGGVLLTQKGFAELPFIHASLKIDDLSNYQLEVINSEFVELDVNNPMIPSKGVLTRNQNPKAIPYTTAKNAIVDNWYPAQTAHSSEPFILRDHRGINVYVNPFQYNAVQQKLRVYTRIQVELIPNQSASINPLNKKPQGKLHEMESLYQSVFLNQVETSDALTIADKGSILVVTTARDEEAIEPYIQWKKEKGLQVYKEVVATATNVKSLIQTQFDAHNDILYVLLVGDWEDIKSDTDGATPGSPMDPMLGCVVGNDSYPDISVGRFSVKTPAEATVMVNKVINYEKNAEGNSFKGALGVASTEGPGDDNEIDYVHQDIIWENKLKPFTYDRYYTAYEPNGNKNDIREALTEGISIINYTGHGSHDSWGTTGFSVTDVNALSNGDKLPYIISVACNNGDFFYGNDCYAEAWTKKSGGGAICMLAATISQPWQPPMRGQDYFNDLLTGGYDYNTNPGSGTSTTEGRTTFGSLVSNSLVLMYKESNTSADIETIQTWTIFGDPSLQVRTDTPHEITLSNESLYIGQDFTTIIAENGIPVQNALIALSKDDLMVSGYTNASGEVTLAHEFAGAGVKLTVTGFNLKTIQKDVMALALNGPVVILKELNTFEGAIIENGKTIEFNTTLENVGTEQADNVTSTITATNDLATVITSEASFGSINSNEVKMQEKAFKVQFKENAEDGQLATFSIVSGSGENTTVSNKSFRINAANLSLAQNLSIRNSANKVVQFLDDDMSGKLTLAIANTGGADSKEVQVTMTASDARVNISTATQTFTSIAKNANQAIEFDFNISNFPEQGEIITFTLAITSGSLQINEELSTQINMVYEDFSSEDFNKFPWAFPEDANWTIEEITSNPSTFAAKSGQIDHNKKSAMVLTYEAKKDDQISFEMKVSSEGSYDKLFFFIDNNKVKEWSGEIAWKTVSFPVSKGVHDYKWVYEKDGLISSGADAAWITNIILPSKTPVGLTEASVTNSILDIYPNPSNDSFYVQYSLKRDSDVRMCIYDIQGQKITEIVKGNLSAGNHHIKIETDQFNMKSGVYFYQINIDGESISKKIVKF